MLASPKEAAAAAEPERVTRIVAAFPGCIERDNPVNGPDII